MLNLPTKNDFKKNPGPKTQSSVAYRQKSVSSKSFAFSKSHKYFKAFIFNRIAEIQEARQDKTHNNNYYRSRCPPATSSPDILSRTQEAYPIGTGMDIAGTA